MQIVIEIPEEMYKWVYDVNKITNDYGTGDFIDLIKNGTPLPKGHERALEAAKVIRAYCDSFPLMSCKGCVFDRATGCTLKNPADAPETWELENINKKLCLQMDNRTSAGIK